MQCFRRLGMSMAILIDHVDLANKKAWKFGETVYFVPLCMVMTLKSLTTENMQV